MGVLNDNYNELLSSINDLAEDILEKSNNFLILYDNSLVNRYRDSSILKTKMKEKIEKGIKNYDSK